MRIVYVCADRGIPIIGEKGASIHVQSMARAFEALGHELKIICSRAGESAGIELDIEQVSVVNTITGSGRADKERGAMAAADAIEQRLIQLYQIWPFDVIYERYSLWSAAGCRAARALGVPVVIEVNAPLMEEQALYRQFECKKEALAIEREIIKSASVLTAVSQQLADYLIKKGAIPEKVHAIGNAVDTENFSSHTRPSQINGIDDSHFVIGFSGSLKLWHGIDILMRAFRSFHRTCPASRLLIVGDGPKRGWAQGFASGADLDAVVHMTGWVPHTRLPGLIARMDIATAPYPPSDSHYFSPLKLYEYLAVGRPIVASRIGQSAELLAGDEKALLVEPGDVNALVHAFKRLYNNPDLSRRLARAAANEGKRYSWRQNAQTIIELLMSELKQVHG